MTQNRSAIPQEDPSFGYSIRLAMESPGQWTTIEARFQYGDDDTVVEAKIQQAIRAQEAFTTALRASIAQQATQKAEMEMSDPGSIVITFGAKKGWAGRTIADIYAEDPGTIEWMAEKAQEERIRNAAQAFLDEQADSSGDIRF